LTPWWGPPSELTYRNNEIALGMGYDILRLQGMKARLVVDGEAFEGTAYFQKVTVQAPSVPWFWGMLHFDDGSYLDWFVPHITPLSTVKDDKPWRKRDTTRIPLKEAGIFHDRVRGETHEFDHCKVDLTKSADNLVDGEGNPLPDFRIRMRNDSARVDLRISAVSRARWTFDQPTRGGMVSHLTYNEYPFEVVSISIRDESGERTESDYDWMHGNAEHSWGFLH
ncbi:MAG: hypothetical protein ABGX11_03800, partial [Candidatus Poseidoniia archaeon]